MSPQKTPSPSTEQAWPPLIYHAHVPLYIKVRDVLITLAGWLLIVDLLEDIWVLVTQWLHLTVFKRKVEVDHLLFTLWGNIHEFFYLSMAFVAVVLLAGLSRRHVLRRPIEGGRRRRIETGQDADESLGAHGSNHAMAQTSEPSGNAPRLIRLSAEQIKQLNVGAGSSEG